jgi:hypothetical protein
MSCEDNPGYDPMDPRDEPEPEHQDEIGPCTAHGRMNCFECYDIAPEDLDEESEDVRF